MAVAACPWPAPDLRPWVASVVHTLTVGVDGWAMHEPLRTGGPRSAAVLDRVEAVGADADPAWFPTDGLVHLDLHTDNILAGDDGTLTGIIDWEGACAGDPRFDLVRFAYDLDGHDQPVWDVVEATASTAELEIELECDRYLVTGTQRFALTPDGLDHTVGVNNRAPWRVPVGLGIHPWFVLGPVRVPADETYGPQ